MLILGSSTWGCGDLQDDWYDGVEILKKADLTGKKVALFACGDGESYGDTFCEAMTHIPVSYTHLFRELLNPESLKVLPQCYVEKYAATKKPLEYLQFQRIGYFMMDKDSTAEHLVFNRTVGLKDT